MKLTLKQQQVKVKVLDGKIVETSQPLSTTDVGADDELGIHEGEDIEKMIERVSADIGRRNDELKNMVLSFPNGEYFLKRYILC